jgi:hypothetical protein
MLLWLTSFSQRKVETGCTITEVRPTQFYEDNQAAIAIAEAPVTKLHDKTRSIGTRDYFCRDCVASGEACVIYVPTKSNLADIMTKAVNRNQFGKLRDQIMGYASIMFFG